MSQSRQNCCLHFGQMTESPGLFPVLTVNRGGFKKIEKEHIIYAIY